MYYACIKWEDIRTLFGKAVTVVGKQCTFYYNENNGHRHVQVNQCTEYSHVILRKRIESNDIDSNITTMLHPHAYIPHQGTTEDFVTY